MFLQQQIPSNLIESLTNARLLLNGGQIIKLDLETVSLTLFLRTQDIFFK